MHERTTRRPRRSLAALLTGAAVLVALAGSSVQGQTDGTARLDRRFRGHVIPDRQVELAAPLEEMLLSIEVDEAQRVKKDDLLALMDDRLQAVVVEAAQVQAESVAAIDRTTLDLEDARMNLERTQEAFDRGGASDFELRRAKLGVGLAEAAQTEAKEAKTLAKANFRLEQRRLERYRIRAPFDGVVVRVLSEIGAMLNDTDKVLVLADIYTLEAQLNLPVEMYGDLTRGATYTLIAGQPVNREITATLQTVNPVIDTGSATFRCVFTIDNGDLALPSGFTVYLKWPASG